jgi:hypothetical protein
MTHTIEISLKVPSLRVRREGKDPETIVNSDVRFTRLVQLEAVPKSGEVLTLSVDATRSLECEVVSSIWHDAKNMFVTACRYSKRSITEADYRALMSAPDWQVRALM